MRRALLAAVLWLGVGDAALALDVCPAYMTIHAKEVLPRIRSGIPFKLLSIAAKNGNIWRRIVHVEYDLWDESVTVETLGDGTTVTKLPDSANVICKALSIPTAPSSSKYQYTLLLNPVLGESLARLASSDDRGGLIKIDWGRLAKDLEAQKILLQTEVGP